MLHYLVLLDKLSTEYGRHWIQARWTCGIGAANIKVPIFDTYQ